MTKSEVDLSKLALERESSPKPSQKSWHRWALRYALPSTIVVGFAALLGSAAGWQWLPRTSVTVLPVIVQRGAVSQDGMPLFQAAGWIEPRPTAINVAALAPGVIDELLVVEGQRVAKGEPIARLIDTDAGLELEKAKAILAIKEGELQRAHAEQKAARTRLANPVHLKAQVAEAESLLARAKTEWDKIPFLTRAAQANADFTRTSWTRKKAAGTAIAGVVVEQAAKEHTAAVAELEELTLRKVNLEQEIASLEDRVTALNVQMELLVEERRQSEEADALVASAKAIRDEAALQLRQAELTLERTVIKSPINGRILRLVAFPGTRVMGLKHTASQSSSTVVEMYDPRQLQVRADVRLEDVPKVQPGAPVEVSTASSGKVLSGKVLRLTSSANIQKNTLEVKVSLEDPPDTISPEMLVTATFIAPDAGSHETEADESEQVSVPAQLIVRNEDGTGIWIVDHDSRASLRRISVGIEAAHGLVVTEGLQVTDKLIVMGREGLAEGALVTVIGEDRSMGVREMQ